MTLVETHGEKKSQKGRENALWLLDAGGGRSKREHFRACTS